MKKILTVLIMLLSIHMNCFAAGAARQFTLEEKSADQFILGLTEASVTYEQVTKNLHGELKKNMTAENFAGIKKNIQTRIGSIKNINFVAYSKHYNPQNGYSNIDDLIYLGTSGKDNIVRFIVTFAEENGTPKIAEFSVAPVETKKN